MFYGRLFCQMIGVAVVVVFVHSRLGKRLGW